MFIFMYRLLWFASLLNICNGIIPIYKFNKKNPLSDLSSITKGSAYSISRTWLSHILYDKYSNSKNYDDHPDCHIIRTINKQQYYIQNNNNIKYIVWFPMSQYKKRSILSVIAYEEKDDKFIIRNIVISPFWTPEKIEMINLRDTLLCIDNITLDEFYESDLRFRLSWSTWQLSK